MTMGLSNEGHDGLCGARKKDGSTCRAKAGFGTPHVGRGPCKHHGGSTWNHVVAAQRAEARDVARTALASVRDVTVDPGADPADQLRRTAAALETAADLVADRINAADLVDTKGRPHGALAEYRKLLAELRSTATALTRVGVPDTVVAVGVGVTVDLDGDRLAADLLAALMPWPDALNAARDVLAQHLDAA